jgi:hypothetical protein
MNINKSMKFEAVKKMAVAVYQPKYDELFEEMANLVKDVYDRTIGPQATLVEKSGIPESFIRRTNYLSLDIWLKNENYRRELKVRNLPEFIKLPSHIGHLNRDHLLVAVDSLIFTVRETRCRVEFSEQHNPDFAERYRVIEQKQASLSKEALGFYDDLTRALMPIRTLKQLEINFPKAVEYFPKPEKTTSRTELAPVELINNITKKLHGLSGEQK